MRLLAYLAGLRPKYKTAVLSNAWTGMRTTFIERYQLDEWFDHLIISSEEGIAKPDPRIYRLAAARLRILPEEAVFVDDAPVNVLAAISLGMQGIQFGSADQVLSELNKITKISAADFKTD
jgi:putative hydrolase of the HAD superfamily